MSPDDLEEEIRNEPDNGEAAGSPAFNLNIDRGQGLGSVVDQTAVRTRSADSIIKL